MGGSNIFATYPSLRDRVVMITGGGSGIGAAMVELFASQGSRVAFIDLADEASQKLADSVAKTCLHKPYFKRCDLMDIPALQEAVREIEAG